LEVTNSNDAPSSVINDHSKLPGDWIEAVDANSGQTYYYNTLTEETSWERPIDDVPDNVGKIAVGRSSSTAMNLTSASSTNKTSDATVALKALSEFDANRSQAGLAGPFTLCDDSLVVEYIESKVKTADILWQLISVAAKSKGRLRSDDGVADRASPEASIVELLLSDPNDVTNTKHRGISKKKKDVYSSQEDEKDEEDAIARVQNLLLRGDRLGAVDEAIFIGDFATALLIASMCDHETYKKVVQKYAESTFHTGSPMYTTALLLSGSLQAPPTRNSSNWGVEPKELRQSWKSHLAAIISNRTVGWDKVVLSLGDRLREIGEVNEAHFCYMVCGCPIATPTDTDARTALLGCDHSDPTSLTLSTKEALVSFERTEAYEWAKRQGNKNASFGSFQPFKLVYSMLLADCGKIDRATQFLESIRIPSISSIPEANRTRMRVTLEDIFEDSTSFALAYHQVKSQLQSRHGIKSKWSSTFLSGKELKIDDSVVQSIELSPPEAPSTTDSVLAQMNLNASLPDPNDFHQSPFTGPFGHDATFSSAKSNLMDVTGYSVDESPIRQNNLPPKTDETKRMAPVRETSAIAPTVPTNTMANDVGSKPPSQQPFMPHPMPSTAAPDTQMTPAPQRFTPPPMTDQKNNRTGPTLEDTSPPQFQSVSKPPEAKPTPITVATPQERKRPKSPPATAPPVMMGKKKTESKKPSTPAPSSGGMGGLKSWFIKKLNPDATECHLPDSEEQPYYDKERKRKFVLRLINFPRLFCAD
jgi:hypothetical protein